MWFSISDDYNQLAQKFYFSGVWTSQVWSPSRMLMSTLNSWVNKCFPRFSSLFFFVVLGIWPRAFSLLDKCALPQSYTPTLLFLNKEKVSYLKVRISYKSPLKSMRRSYGSNLPVWSQIPRKDTHRTPGHQPTAYSTVGNCSQVLNTDTKLCAQGQKGAHKIPLTVLVPQFCHLHTAPFLHKSS